MSRTIKGLTVRKMTVTDTLISGEMRHELCMRNYANGCRAQPVPFLEGIWALKPYRRQGVVFALVKTIKRDFQAEGLTELYFSAYIKNTVSHSAHQS